MDKKPMYLLTYDHGGYILWGDRIEARLDLVMGWLEKYPKLKIGLDYEAFTFDEMARTAPRLFAKVKAMLARFPGRMALGSTTYGQPLSLFISEESNVRQLTYAVRTNLRRFGQTPPVYAISEFALHDQLPQLLRGCGYRNVLFRTHVMNYGYQKSFDAAYGFWQGKDGTAIPAIPTYKGAGEGYTNTTLDNWILTRWPDDSIYSPMDFEQRFGKYTPLLASRYDDISNGTEALVACVQDTDNYFFVLLEDLPAIYGEPTGTLETCDNDFHGRMPWGYCGSEIFNGVRKAETDAALAERLNAFSVLLGGASMQPTLESAWRNVLVAQHHDVTICGLLDEAHRFIGDSLASSEKAITQTLDTLAPQFARADAESLFVCNTNSFPVSAWVEAGGAPLEAAAPVDRIDGRTYVYVDMPALTAQSIPLAGTPVAGGKVSYDKTAGVLQTPYLRIALNGNGIRYIDLADGTRLADNGGGALLCGCIEDRDEVCTGTWNVQTGAHIVKAVYTGEIGGIPLRFSMQTDAFSARIDCSAAFDLRGEHVGRIGVTKGNYTAHVVNGSVHENKLRFVLNLCLDHDRRMVRDLPFAIADWDDILPEPEDFWYEGRTVLVDHVVPHDKCFASACYPQGVYWLALRDKKNGLAVLNRGCMGSAVEGNRLSIPLIFANDYMCGTKMLHGTFENAFALLPAAADMTDTDIHKAALAYNYPLLPRRVAKGCGTHTDFSVRCAPDGSDVILTALYPEDDGVFMRVCNFGDTPQTLENIDAAVETDLLGNPAAAIENGTLTLRPWEVKTIRLAFSSEFGIRNSESEFTARPIKS